MLRRPLAVVSALASLLALAAPAASQSTDRLPRFVVDLQASVPRLPTDAEIAARRDLDVTWLPSWGVGVNAGVHAYPLRWKLVTFGIGGSFFWGGRSRTQDVLGGESEPSGPKVTTRLRGFAPQVSFNFGGRDGFSYLSGGISPAVLTVSREDAPAETGEGAKTINYGGGARWFFSDRMAFSVDLRFYAIAPKLPSDKGGGHPRVTQMIASAGLSFR
jgi:hypothetical protein